MLLVPTYVAPSQIHGIGLYASEPIAKGTPMWAFEPALDRLIDPALLETLPDHVRRFIIHFAYETDQIPGGLVLGFDDSRFINHASTPNTDNTQAITVAARDINAGEEITCDYGEFCVSYDLND